jgi:ATP-dependent RNA helicase UAP56/SUB2
MLMHCASRRDQATVCDCFAGRFGTRGIAITMISSREETEILNEVQERFDVGIEQLPPLSEIDKATYTNA